MATFVWEGKERGGSDRKGSIAANSLSDAKNKLKQQGIEISKISKKAEGAGIVATILKFIPFIGGVPRKNLVIFTRQFATMIDSGLPLVQALDLLQQGESHKLFKSVIGEVKTDVESGSTFADALKKHPNVFDTLFVNLVAAGELGGVLDTILNRLAAYI